MLQLSLSCLSQKVESEVDNNGESPPRLTTALVSYPPFYWPSYVFQSVLAFLTRQFHQPRTQHCNRVE